VRRVEDVEKPSVTCWFIITGAISAMRGVESEIKPVDTGFRGYDRIFVGSPVWGRARRKNARDGAAFPVSSTSEFLRSVCDL
jgi:hypothetical protein